MSLGLGRRALLRAIAAIPGIGTVAGADRDAVGRSDATEAGWPQFGHDRANTWTNPTAPGPGDGVSADWRGAASGGLWLVVVDGSVYVATDGGVRAFATDGRERWSRSTAGSVSGLVSDGDVLYAAVGDEAVVSLDADGNRRWRATPSGRPFMVTAAYDGAFAAGADGYLTRFDGGTGGITWERNLGGTLVGPAVHDGKVYVPVAGGPLTVLDAGDGEVLFRSEAQFRGVRPPTVIGSFVFVPTSGGVVALDRSDGGKRWEFGGDWSAVAVGRDGPIVGVDGTVAELAPSDGSVTWSYNLANVSGLAVPTVVNDTVIVPDGSVLRGLWMDDGTERWTRGLEGTSRLAVPAGTDVYTVVDGSTVVGLAGEGGSAALALSATGGTTTAGGDLELAFELANDGSAAAESPTVVVESLPDPVTVAGSDDAGGTWETDRRWTIDSLPAGETVRPSLTLSVDADADPETYTVPSHVETGDGRTADSASATVEVTAPPSLTLESVRPVQTVVDSHVPGVSHDPIPDPDLVATRPTSVLFQFEGERVGDLDDGATVPLTVRTDRGTEKSATLRGKRVKELSHAPDESADAVDPERVLADAPRAERPPVFEIDPEASTLSVAVGGDGTVDGDGVELSAGSDFGYTRTTTLTVGFIELEAPKDGGSYPYGAGNDGRLLKRYRKPGGDASLTAENARGKFEAVVDEAERYLERVYPVEGVETKVHPSTVQGVPKGFWDHVKEFAPLTDDNLVAQDLREAHDRLVDEFDGLDATVAIVPDGYFSYHEGNAFGGVELTSEPGGTQPQTATCAMEQVSYGNSLGDVASTVAQEIGHHTEGLEAYPDKIAQRRGNKGTERDNSHARTEDMENESGAVIDRNALRSTGFDLFDGTYSVLREGSTRGYWGIGRHGVDGSQDREWRLGSFMSYGSDDVWADAHVFQRMIDDAFAPDPPLESDDGDDGGWIFAGTAAVGEDGEVRVVDSTRRKGSPMADASEGTVSLEVTGPDGSTIATRRSPDSTLMLGHGSNETIEGMFTFAVPFPEETESVRIRHEEHDTETTVNPVEFTLRSAVRALPDRAFTDDPDRRREELLSAARSVTEHMDAGEYDAAAETLRGMREDVTSWVKADYGAAANQPTREELLELIDDALSRTDTIAAAAGATGGGSVLEVPDWLPLAGGGAVTLGLGAAAYRLFGGGDGEEEPAGEVGPADTSEGRPGRRGPNHRGDDGRGRRDRIDRGRAGDDARQRPDGRRRNAEPRTSGRTAGNDRPNGPRDRRDAAADREREGSPGGRATESSSGSDAGRGRTCSDCGAEVHPEAAFCTACGSDLDDGSADGGRTCPACDAGVHPEASFCTECGEKL